MNQIQKRKNQSLFIQREPFKAMQAIKKDQHPFMPTNQAHLRGPHSLPQGLSGLQAHHLTIEGLSGLHHLIGGPNFPQLHQEMLLFPIHNPALKRLGRDPHPKGPHPQALHKACHLPEDLGLHHVDHLLLLHQLKRAECCPQCNNLSPGSSAPPLGWQAM